MDDRTMTRIQSFFVAAIAVACVNELLGNPPHTGFVWGLVCGVGFLTAVRLLGVIR